MVLLAWRQGVLLCWPPLDAMEGALEAALHWTLQMMLAQSLALYTQVPTKVAVGLGAKHKASDLSGWCCVPISHHIAVAGRKYGMMTCMLDDLLFTDKVLTWEELRCNKSSSPACDMAESAGKRSGISICASLV